MLNQLMADIRYKRPSSTSLTNYTRGREKLFRNYMNVYPLSTDSKVSHYVALTIHAEWMDINGCKNSTESLSIKEMRDEKTDNETTSLQSMSNDSSNVKIEQQDEIVPVVTSLPPFETSIKCNTVVQADKEAVADMPIREMKV